jgi:hypothetical protein
MLELSNPERDNRVERGPCFTFCVQEGCVVLVSVRGTSLMISDVSARSNTLCTYVVINLIYEF